MVRYCFFAAVILALSSKRLKLCRQTKPKGYLRLINMHQEKLAKWFLTAAALSTLIVPIGVDAIVLADGHMNNPAWLPHAKLHCAMSFFAAISLGGSALAILKVRPVTDRFSMTLAAFLGSAFWIGLIAAGFWPGTSYGFLNDPVLGNISEPELGGITIYPNVVASLLTIATALVGYWLTKKKRSIDH
ncbi:hypothetical protein [Dendronalium sp. ChiSLP03b]|uniref:hypothetical protein n=1 Tax=Dendronalium sp. ChiSLP03b TaxID=3075381 RepID=UPI002AD5388D|nr:hypothetical protein [Dendronalium sp. ChiSLP03b]MDZ8208795.1 hypothetical protein [Dendronalium sp. ChiSLP03b]